jgi:hypothetical protein
MDVTNVEQAKIAEDAGAVAVMALERVPADIRRDGGVARMSDPEMATSRGAALAAWVALGRISVEEISSLVRRDATFSPQPRNRQMYAMLFDELLCGYKATRPMFRRLNAPRPKQ